MFGKVIDSGLNWIGIMWWDDSRGRTVSRHNMERKSLNLRSLRACVTVEVFTTTSIMIRDDLLSPLLSERRKPKLIGMANSQGACRRSGMSL